jgi:hypothetical protein
MLMTLAVIVLQHYCLALKLSSARTYLPSPQPSIVQPVSSPFSDSLLHDKFEFLHQLTEQIKFLKQIKFVNPEYLPNLKLMAGDYSDIPHLDDLIRNEPWTLFYKRHAKLDPKWLQKVRDTILEAVEPEMESVFRKEEPKK